MSVIFRSSPQSAKNTGNPGRNENERHTIWWEKPIFNGGIPSCTADGVRCKNWG